MGMSTRVDAIRKPDENWLRLKAVWDACRTADVSIPEEVSRFFKYEEPDESGVVIPLNSGEYNIAREWQDKYSASGYEIDLADLPPHVTTLRFYNSY